MNNPNFYRLLLGLSCVFLLSFSSSAIAATASQMKACKMAVLEQSKFHDLPMAAVSVYPGGKASHALFSIRWDGLTANGYCKVKGVSAVKKVKINNFNDGRYGNNNSTQGSSNNENEMDGFYFDRHIGKWRDPQGETCHTCTPENGFPNHHRSYY